MNTNELNAMQIRIAIRHAEESIDGTIKALKRAVEEAEQHKKRFENSETLYEKSNQINFLLHHLTANMMGNLRIDLLAHSQAELNGAYEIERSMQQEEAA